MTCLYPEDDEAVLAFREWKKKWKIEYATPDEEQTRFENFGKNYRYELEFDPPSEPLWMVLNVYADLPIDCHFGYIRLDDELESDDEDEDATFWVDFPVKQEDGTTRSQRIYPPSVDGMYKFIEEEMQRHCDQKKYDTQEEDQDASVKHQSTVLPVKRTSDDDKDDTKEEDQDKRQKIGCAGAKNEDVAVTAENEKS